MGCGRLGRQSGRHRRNWLRLNLATTDDRNAWYLYVELFWAAILGIAAAFNAAFAVHLGAKNSHIGLLNALPALVAILVSIPAGRFLERRAKRQAWVLGSLFVNRMGYVLVALVPWLPTGEFNKGAVLVALLVAMSAVYLMSTLGLGLLVSTVSETQQQAMMTSSFFFMLPMVFLSGFVFPIENMPAVIQPFTYLIPLRYFLVILRGIFLKGVGLSVLWPQALALLCWGLAILGLATMRSRKRLG